MSRRAAPSFPRAAITWLHTRERTRAPPRPALLHVAPIRTRPHPPHLLPTSAALSAPAAAPSTLPPDGGRNDLAELTSTQIYTVKQAGGRLYTSRDQAHAAETAHNQPGHRPGTRGHFSSLKIAGAEIHIPK